MRVSLSINRESVDRFVNDVALRLYTSTIIGIKFADISGLLTKYYPRWTMTLIKSFRAGEPEIGDGKISAVISTNVKYARFIEYGTKRHFVPAKHIIAWAVDHNKTTMLEYLNGKWRGMHVKHPAIRFFQYRKAEIAEEFIRVFNDYFKDKSGAWGNIVSRRIAEITGRR